MISTVFVAAGVAMLVVAALHDVMARTVPNELALAVAAVGLLGQISVAVAWIAAGPDWSARVLPGLAFVGISLLAGIVVFVLAALMWRRGWMGGGDVKLLAAAALVVPAGLVPSMIAATAIAGGGLSFIYLASRRRLARPGPGRAHGLLARIVKAERWRLRRGGPLPYAVAIACGAFFALSNGGLS